MEIGQERNVNRHRSTEELSRWPQLLGQTIELVIERRNAATNAVQFNGVGLFIEFCVKRDERCNGSDASKKVANGFKSLDSIMHCA